MLLISSLVGCGHQTTTQKFNNSVGNNAKVTVEGVAIYFEGGGTVEHQFPPGFQLIECKWISLPSKLESKYFTYLSGSIDTIYLNRRVRAVGTLDSIAVHWQFNNGVDYALKINVDSLQIVN